MPLLRLPIGSKTNMGIVGAVYNTKPIKPLSNCAIDAKRPWRQCWSFPRTTGHHCHHVPTNMWRRWQRLITKRLELPVETPLNWANKMPSKPKSIACDAGLCNAPRLRSLRVLLSPKSQSILTASKFLSAKHWTNNSASTTTAARLAPSRCLVEDSITRRLTVWYSSVCNDKRTARRRQDIVAWRQQ
jgi:hypothetical protein